MSCSTAYDDIRSLYPFPLAWLLIIGLLVVQVPDARTQTYGRGFVPPPDYERILAERLVVYPDKNDLPSTWDWRAHNGVTPVKDQGSCGSCWAFAAVAEMESKINIYYNRIVDLSEQQIISCNPYGSGCGGGWAGSAYYVMMHHGGILEHCMPYQGSDGVPCTQNDYLKFTNISTWNSISNNVTQIKTAVLNNGPVCTSVDANAAWEGYSGGVITAPGSGTNHLVLIVGWDDRLGSNGAWIVKNSWGGGWGMNGYCYVAYGACNIGSGVTSLTYTAPPVRVGVGTPPSGAVLYSDDYLTLQWSTINQPVDHVNIWYGTAGSCQTEIVALNVPNTGSYEWLLPNVTTSRATVLVYPSEGTHRGFGFNNGEFTILGKQTRYVSLAGSNTPPYDTPAKAAHSIGAAVLAGAGRDSVLVAGGDYLESGVTVGSQCFVVGGWSADFSVCDPDLYPTRLRGPDGAMRFQGGAGDHCGVANITFHDSQGRVGTVPVAGRHGAAILSQGVSPSIENCRFENNRADPGNGAGWGGAILAHGGAPVIRNSVFVGNVGSRGGAIALSECAGALIEDCLFLGNATSDSLATYPGAAIYVHGGMATIRDSELRGGGAGVGGGLALAGGAQVIARDLVVANNRASHGGAGIHSYFSALDLVRGEIAQNTNWSGQGGGVFTEGGQLTLANVLMIGNHAPSLGGGLYALELQGGTLRNNVWHQNSGQNTGGAMVDAAGPLAFHNNVITASTGGGVRLMGTEVASDHNISFGNSGSNFQSAMGAHDLAVDPRYVSAAAGDFAPAMHSPLVDSGHQGAGADWDGSPTDRGLHGGPAAKPGGPTAVQDLQGEVVAGEVSLTWAAVEGAVSYVVYRAAEEHFVAAPQLACAIVAAPQTAYQETIPEGDWYYLIGAIDADGRAGGFSQRFVAAGGQSAVGDPAVPQALAIATVAPNPFNPRTTIHFDLPRAGAVVLQVFDMRGRMVVTLVDGDLPAGRHSVVWQGDDSSGRRAATGVYALRLQDGQEIRTVKAVLAK